MKISISESLLLTVSSIVKRINIRSARRLSTKPSDNFFDIGDCDLADILVKMLSKKVRTICIYNDDRHTFMNDEQMNVLKEVIFLSML